MDILKTASTLAVPVIAGIVTYVLNHRAERRSRAAQYQLEQIEKILSAIAESAATNEMFPPNSTEAQKVSVKTQRAMALIPLYGSEEVLEVFERNKGKKYSPEAIEEFSNALYAQGRALVNPRGRGNI